MFFITFCSLKSPTDSPVFGPNGIIKTPNGVLSDPSSSGPEAPFASSPISDAELLEPRAPRPLLTAKINAI